MLKFLTGTFPGQAELARKLGTTKQNISRIIKRLIRDTLIEEIPKLFPKQYKLTPKGINHCKQILELSHDNQHLRSHNIILVAEILRQPEKWEFKTNVFHQVSDVATMTNWKQQFQGYYLNNYFLISPSSISLRIKEIYAASAEESIFQALDIFKEFLNILMESHKRLTIKVRQGTVRISSIEIAIEGDKLAEKVTNMGEKIITKRFVIDSSKGVPEIEFVDKDLCQDDVRAYEDFVHKVINKEIKPEELASSNVDRIVTLLEKFGHKIETISTSSAEHPGFGRAVVKLAEEMYVRNQK